MDEYYFGARILGVDQVQYTNCGLIDFKSRDGFSDRRFYVYPNPTTSILTIATDDENSIAHEFELRDLKGTIVKRFLIVSKTGMAQLDIGDLNDGTYLYSIIGNGAIIESGKIVKLRD